MLLALNMLFPQYINVIHITLQCKTVVLFYIDLVDIKQKLN